MILQNKNLTNLKINSKYLEGDHEFTLFQKLQEIDLKGCYNISSTFLC